MKNEYDNLIKFSWFRTILFLLVVCGSQISPIYHVYHFHDDELSEFAFSSHPTDVEHASDHHHHDEDRSQAEDHEHRYDTQFNWFLGRIQFQNNIAVTDQHLFSLTTNSINNYNVLNYILINKSLKQNSVDVSTQIIRGPPQIV